MEKQRLAHTKEIARRYLEAINMTDTTDLKAEYERLKVIIGDANPDEIIELVFLFHFYGFDNLTKFQT